MSEIKVNIRCQHDLNCEIVYQLREILKYGEMMHSEEDSVEAVRKAKRLHDCVGNLEILSSIKRLYRKGSLHLPMSVTLRLS